MHNLLFQIIRRIKEKREPKCVGCSAPAAVRIRYDAGPEEWRCENCAMSMYLSLRPLAREKKESNQ